MVAFNRAMLAFYAHPSKSKGSADEYAYRALDCVLSCETKLLIIDDMHFLRWRNTAGLEISNHFKYIANEFPVTLIYVGVDLDKRGLFYDGLTSEDRAVAQTARRTTKLAMGPFDVRTDHQRRVWHQLLLTIEQRVVLANKRPGMIATDLSDYLFARSTGHIGSLMTLINRGCTRGPSAPNPNTSTNNCLMRSKPTPERTAAAPNSRPRSAEALSPPQCRGRSPPRDARRHRRIARADEHRRERRRASAPDDDDPHAADPCRTRAGGGAGLLG